MTPSFTTINLPHTRILSDQTGFVITLVCAGDGDLATLRRVLPRVFPPLLFLVSTVGRADYFAGEL